MIPPITSVKRIKYDGDLNVSDEAFEPAFLEEPYVFEGDSSFSPQNSYVKGHRSGSFFFVREEDHLENYGYNVRDARGNFAARISKNDIGWMVTVLKEDDRLYHRLFQPIMARKGIGFKNLSEVVALFQKAVQFVTGIHYEKGILDGTYENTSWTSLHPPVSKAICQILLNEPVGTCLLVGKEHLKNCKYVLINVGDEKIHTVNIKDSSYSPPILPSDFFYQKEIINLYKDSHYQHLKGRLKICESILDLTFLERLAPTSVHRTLNNCSPEFLTGIKHITFYHSIHHSSDRSESLKTLAEFLIHLAKIGRMDVCIHTHKTSILDDVTSYCLYMETMAHIRQELKGEPLQWALDTFLEIPFYRTWSEPKKLAEHVVDPSWHEFYNDEKKEPTIKVQLAQSGRIIYAHKANLARLSPLLNNCLYTNWKETTEGVFIFREHPDEIVEQFIKVAYGFTPDFSNCNLLDLLKLANFTQSPLFMSIANRTFNEEAESIGHDFIRAMIEENLWKALPDKTFFFQLVGTYWAKIVSKIPAPEQDSFRDSFLQDWKSYLDELHRGFIKA